MTMVAPAIMVSAASAPTIMMAAASAAHMPAAVPMPALHLDHGVILCNESAGRRRRQPCRSRQRPHKRRSHDDSNQCYVFHGRFFPGRMIAILTQYPGPKIVPFAWSAS